MERMSSLEAIDLPLLSSPEGKTVDLERISLPEAIHLSLLSSPEGKTVDLGRISSLEAIDLASTKAATTGERKRVENKRAEANDEGEGKHEKEEKRMTKKAKMSGSVLDLPDVPRGQLPPHLELQRTRVVCKSDAPIHTEGIHYSGAYASMGVDNGLRLDNFCNNFRVDIIRLTEDEIEFDMVGIDAALANAFRRILIAELPTMAIEKVLVANNTSVINDEVLAHRLGLVPIKADPRLFEYPSENGSANETNTIVFKLDVKCPKGGARMKGVVSYHELAVVVFLADVSFQTVLGPGQAIELEAHAVKGMGKTHAKWSPVATAWYRMLPEVVLKEEILDEKAEELVKKCPVHVFDVEDIGKALFHEWRSFYSQKIVAETITIITIADIPIPPWIVNFLNTRFCLKRKTIKSRAKESENAFVEKIGKTGLNYGVLETTSSYVDSHFLDQRIKFLMFEFHYAVTIESTGALPPEVLFTEAVKILEDKCERIITELS
ncbi:hypothetical protein ACLOJK_031007 [Asimina triloba]